MALMENGQHADMGNGASSRVMELTESTQTFSFECFSSEPVISPLRGFSAPVRLKMEQSQENLIALMGADNDPFVKWDASQRLAYAAIDRGAKALERDYVDALKQVLSSDIEDAMKAQLLSLPTEASLADRAAQTGLINVYDIHDARTNMAEALGHALSSELEAIVMSSLAVTDTYQPSAEQIGRRSL